MNLSERDKRAVKWLAYAAVPSLVMLLWPAGDNAANNAASAVPAGVNTPEALEKHLQRLRKKQAELPVKQTVAKDLLGQLVTREKGLIRADTLAQAQAQLTQVIRQTGRGQGIDFRAVSTGQSRIYGGEYGEIMITASADCKIEQLVNFLAEITKLPELLSTEDLRINSNGNVKEKNLNFQVSISGLVPKKLIPEKRSAL